MRKTYGTKAMAKKARNKGQSVYKVKGGYRLTKPMTKKRPAKRRMKKR